MAFIRSDSSAVDVSATAPAATNFIDMLLKLIAFANDSNNSVQEVGSIAAGGTSGYAVGDILQLDDGAATEAFPSVLANCRATFEVTAVSSGQVTAVRIRNAGCYSTLPTDNGTVDEFDTTILSGSGVGVVSLGGVLFDGNGWTIDRITQEVDTVAIGAAAGTGYSTGADVRPVGGDTRTGYDAPQSNNFASFNVDSQSGGAVTALSILSRGIYHRNPGTNEVASLVTAGTGNNDLTLDLTFRDITDSTTPREVWLSSTAGAQVGIRTYTDGSSVFNWELASTPAFTAASDWESQPNISPGRYQDDGTGSYVVLENETFNFWMSITDRRITCVFNLAPGIYTNMTAQLVDAYATTTEHAFPMLIGGCSSRHNFNQSTNASGFAGAPQAVAEAATDNGPVQIYSPGGFWRQVHNGTRSVNDVIGDDDVMHIFPCGWFDPQDAAIAADDRIVDDSTVKRDWESFASVATSGAGGFGVATSTLTPTDGTDDQIPLIECVVGGIEPSNEILASLSGIYWVEQTLSSGTLTAEDQIIRNDLIHYVFNNCRLTGRTHYFAMEAA